MRSLLSPLFTGTVSRDFGMIGSTDNLLPRIAHCRYQLGTMLFTPRRAIQKFDPTVSRKLEVTSPPLNSPVSFQKSTGVGPYWGTPWRKLMGVPIPMITTCDFRFVCPLRWDDMPDMPGIEDQLIRVIRVLCL